MAGAALKDILWQPGTDNRGPHYFPRKTPDDIPKTTTLENGRKTTLGEITWAGLVLRDRPAMVAAGRAKAPSTWSSVAWTRRTVRQSTISWTSACEAQEPAASIAPRPAGDHERSSINPRIGDNIKRRDARNR